MSGIESFQGKNQCMISGDCMQASFALAEGQNRDHCWLLLSCEDFSASREIRFSVEAECPEEEAETAVLEDDSNEALGRTVHYKASGTLSNL